eukprot:TRINITY_DN19507_c0_g1_i1.p1 TRINITY_DN19507_c0_g1~~TRINITY_DN19507_c0_g1_i1.p1  ORF type:complete len:382 (+),score=45.10 TRINITY_DN19507_c0_g1_i1:84-1229(+)
MGSTGPTMDESPGGGTVGVQIEENKPVLPKIPMFHGFPYRRKVVPMDVARTMPKRRHGFHRPWHLLQVASWVLLVGFFVIVMVMVVPFLPSFWKFVGYGVFCLGYLVVLWANYKACMTDPVDPGTKFDEHTNCYEHDAVPSVKCTVCKAWIRAESKHCKPCNKCISDFDHHCKWMNTCVGASNYVYFYTFLAVTLLLSTMLAGVLSWLMADTYQSTGRYHKLLDDNLNGMPLTNYRAALMCILVLDVVAWLLLAELFKFHGQLSFRRMTTYEWIMATRKNILMTSSLAKAASPPSEAEMVDLCDGGGESIDEIDDQNESQESSTEEKTEPPHSALPLTVDTGLRGATPPDTETTNTQPIVAKLDLKSPSSSTRRLPPLGSS